jgi:hypothetical protein
MLESIAGGHIKGPEVGELLNTHFANPGDDDVAGYFLAWFSNSEGEARMQGLNSLGEARQQKRIGERVGLALQRYGQALLEEGERDE